MNREINRLWHFHDELTVHEAASLLAGYDPSYVDLCRNDTNFEQNFSDFGPAMSLLTNAINAGKLKATIRRAAWERGWDEEPGKDERFEKSIQLLDSDVSEAWEQEAPINSKIRGIIYRVSPDWSKTTVSVETLKDWLSNRGLKTDFFFPDTDISTDKPSLPNTLSAPAGRWPWGDHHTELLGHLEAAAREFWTNYDPQNVKATAPKNETVIAWLKERKVSNAMASAIATMLRPDDLPSGPRK